MGASDLSMRRRNAREFVASKRIKAAHRRIGPAHPGYGSLKHFARWANTSGREGEIFAARWLASKGCR